MMEPFAQENMVRIPNNMKEIAELVLWNRNGEYPGTQTALEHLEELLSDLPEENRDQVRNAVFRIIRQGTEDGYRKGLEFGRFLAENK